MRCTQAVLDALKSRGLKYTLKEGLRCHPDPFVVQVISLRGLSASPYRYIYIYIYVYTIDDFLDLGSGS